MPPMAKIKNQRELPCERCGSKSEVKVVADGWDDAPESFTITRTCSGGCTKTYTQMTAAKMHAAFNLPLTGWSSTEF